MIDVFKREIADALGRHLSQQMNKTVDSIYGQLEIPKNQEHGHLAFPVFSLAKELRKAPPLIATEISQALSGQIPSISAVKPIAGFVNFTISPVALQNNLIKDVLNVGQLGLSTWGAGKKVVIDFSSPNIAKPMHIGHLRATVIGQAIKNLAASQGFNAIGVNHIGDWGSQFGKLAWAIQNWAKDSDFSVNPMGKLVDLYIRFHQEAEKDPELEKRGAETFKKLENGDPEIRAIWQRVIDDSFKDYNRLYKLLGTKHELVLGESFYNDKLDDVIKRLSDHHLLKESEGAQVVFFDESENMPPCLIKKSDGASIYATRDLAAAIYRKEVLGGDHLLYLVGQEQSLHFKQVFRVLNLLGYPWAKDCHHVSFGLYKFKDGKMSTRQGKVILFEDVINRTVELVRSMIEEKNPDLENKEKIAEQVAIGAVVFHDLLNDRVKNIDFDWDKVISVEGDSGPYVQYTHVRCHSLLRKFGRPIDFQKLVTLDSPEEQRLIFVMLQFQDVVTLAYRNYKPNLLAQYLLDLCSAFSHFYHKHRVLGESRDVENSRMALVHSTAAVLSKGMSLLNMPAPEAM